jgi:subtilisin-like proprotein convertase family protein
MKVIYSLLFALLFCFGLNAQTYNGAGGAIPDDGSTNYYPLTVSGLSPATIDSTFGLETVCIDITHTWDSDLNISLQAPDGTTIDLTIGNGGSGQNYTNTCFNANASTSIVAGSPPFTGTFRPQGMLGNINNGQNGNGTWNLVIHDTYPFADQGTVLGWSITFGNNPATPPFIFSSSDLPIIVINTNNNQSIPDEPKVMADMGIIYNGPSIRNNMTDPFNHYNGKITIEVRGSSSQMFPQKAYGLETVDLAGNNFNTALLGMPSEHDWILFAPYTDKTLMRNSLTYQLSRDMGHWAARTRFCEVVINGQYRGVYVLMEKIKRDNDRVDIAKLTIADTTGDELTGGYIVKIDKLTGNGGGGWTSPYPPAVVPNNGQTIYFQYHYPEGTEILPQQEAYIQQYVDSFETSLASINFADPVNGFRKYADVTSFIDFFIINELSKNVDGYRLSTYLYKDKYSKGGKLTIGPAWDFNLGWWNADYCAGNTASGWAYQFGSTCPGDSWQVPTWWQRMMQDTNFVNQVRCRWEWLRTNTLISAVDSMAAEVAESQARHYITWPILGVYVWPNPSPLAQTFAGEISNLKTWINMRASWLDANIPGNCVDLGIHEGNAIAAGLNAYPNPFNNSLNVNFRLLKNADVKIEIFNALGAKVKELELAGNAGFNETAIDLSGGNVSAGVYIIRLTSGGSSVFTRVSKVE